MLALRMRPVTAALSRLFSCSRCIDQSSSLSRSFSSYRYCGLAQTSPLLPWSRRYSSTRTEDRQEAGSDYFGAGGPEPYYTASKADEEEFQIKLKILASALNHVNIKGWSSDSLKAGAADLNLSESISSLCTPYDLVEYFQRSSNHQLEVYLKGLDKKEKSLYNSMEYRLKQVVPFIDRYHQAMGLSLEPINIPKSLKVLRELSDIICVNGLGDTSTDLRWYTKRTGIVSLYVATECCMVQDKSENFLETWKFLERRIKDYEFFERTSSSVMPVVESSVTTILNILGMNRRR